MNINEKLQLVALKTKLIYKYQLYISFLKAKTATHCKYDLSNLLDHTFTLLKEKYCDTDPSSDGFVNSIKKHTQEIIKLCDTCLITQSCRYDEISSSIYNNNNKELLTDFLMCIDV